MKAHQPTKLPLGHMETACCGRHCLTNTSKCPSRKFFTDRSHKFPCHLVHKGSLPDLAIGIYIPIVGKYFHSLVGGIECRLATCPGNVQTQVQLMSAPYLDINLLFSTFIHSMPVQNVCSLHVHRQWVIMIVVG